MLRESGLNPSSPAAPQDKTSDPAEKPPDAHFTNALYHAGQEPLERGRKLLCRQAELRPTVRYQQKGGRGPIVVRCGAAIRAFFPSWYPRTVDRRKIRILYSSQAQAPSGMAYFAWRKGPFHAATDGLMSVAAGQKSSFGAYGEL